jgi:hypothetical protein
MSNYKSVGMTVVAVAMGALVMVAPVGARGIIKGAAKGAAVGHFVGHGHAKAGAMVGAVHGHHHAMKKAAVK